MTNPFYIRVNGSRRMRVTPLLESFTSCDDDWTPVDIRDIETGIEAQAIILARTARASGTAIIGDSQVRDAIRSAYLNATKANLPERFSVALRDEGERYVSRYEIHGRNGHHPIEEYQPDNPVYGEHCPVGNPFISRLSKRDALTVCGMLSAAWRKGAEYGQRYPGASLPGD